MAEYVKSVTEYSDVKRAMLYSLNEGIAKGEKRGISFRNYEIARTGLKEGVSLEVISKLTGLTTEEILKVK
ncbi:MAG: hypothetical protein LBO74_14325 [Candidatus Symbiothrix sp.]|jgi:hypothetical protein|nr:hypothetical protein [Candidatus Symbiothrix sp.]